MKTPRNINKNDNPSFGERLKEAFSEKTNVRIADLLGVGESTVSNYIKGRVPSPEKLVNISNLTGFNIHWLLTGEGEKVIERRVSPPVTLVFNGGKGGAGTTTAASVIALMLSQKKRRVLLISNAKIHDIYLGLSRNNKAAWASGLPNSKKDVELNASSYLPSWSPSLHLFIPKGTIVEKGFAKVLKPFGFGDHGIAANYDYLIFDVNYTFNPFSVSPTNSFENVCRCTFGSFINVAKVVVPYQPNNSRLDSINSALRQIENSKDSYSGTEFLAVFVNNYDRELYRAAEGEADEVVDEIYKLHEEKICKTEIRRQPEQMRYLFENTEDAFARGSELLSDYEKLLKELEAKLGQS